MLCNVVVLKKYHQWFSGNGNNKICFLTKLLDNKCYCATVLRFVTYEAKIA